MGFFILVFLLHTLINIYLFYKGWKALPVSRIIRILYSILFVAVFLSFPVAMLGRYNLPLPFLKELYFIGTTWMIIMLYGTIWFLLTDLIAGIDRIFRPKSRKRRRKPEHFNRRQILAGTIILIPLLLYGNYNFSHPQIVEKELLVHKDAGTTKELKIVAFSDLHLGVAIDKGRLKRYVQLINEQKPDVVLIAGDLIDNCLRPLNEEKMWEELNQLEAPMGVYACLGNHEYLSGIDESLDFLKKTNIQLLIDDVSIVGDSIYIVGRNDRYSSERKPLEMLLSGIDRAHPLILLDHQPYYLVEAMHNGVDLQFSGHTHRGQLFPLNLLIGRMYELGYGYKKKGDTHYYVSSGLGLWGPQFRIGTRSELVVFNIRFN